LLDKMTRIFREMNRNDETRILLSKSIFIF
jgi:hypothetical protein